MNNADSDIIITNGDDNLAKHFKADDNVFILDALFYSQKKFVAIFDIYTILFKIPNLIFVIFLINH